MKKQARYSASNCPRFAPGKEIVGGIRASPSAGNRDEVGPYWLNMRRRCLMQEVIEIYANLTSTDR